VALLGLSACRVFYDGTTTEPRLDHPECVAVHPDGSVWCGGELGQIYRIDPDGVRLEVVASTGGFCLGLALDADGNVFVCDLKHSAVMRWDSRRRTVEWFASGVPGHAMRIPNYPAFDPAGRLYVSDSYGPTEPGPGIFRFEPDGSGTLWFDEPLQFANGLALSPDGAHVYVAETFANAIIRIPIQADGSAGRREEIARLPGVLPDGLAFDQRGDLYVGCYEPSQVLRIGQDGKVECVVADPQAHMLCHPTNLAWRGTTLFTANLGRWHITAIELGGV
jgi:sugar lactone lactonase YvrE